jgi:hypothetical protein
MNKITQIYYNALLGALGGLIGWWAVGSVATQLWPAWPAAAFVGAGVGMAISALIAATDGAVVKRVAHRALRDGVLGAIAGVVAGALGMLLALAVFLQLQGGWEGRTFSWMLLGTLIGAGDYIVSRQRRRALYAAIGGMLGGLVGGLGYEALTLAFINNVGAQIWLSGLGLTLIGACIGAFIPLTRQILARAELHVLNGQQSGLVREITDSAAIGRYDGNELYLPDGGIAWRHAVVARDQRGFTLEVLPEAGPVYLGARIVGPGTRVPLANGDRIQIGEALVEFVGR